MRLVMMATLLSSVVSTICAAFYFAQGNTGSGVLLGLFGGVLLAAYMATLESENKKHNRS